MVRVQIRFFPGDEGDFFRSGRMVAFSHAVYPVIKSDSSRYSSNRRRRGFYRLNVEQVDGAIHRLPAPPWKRRHRRRRRPQLLLLKIGIVNVIRFGRRRSDQLEPRGARKNSAEHGFF